MFTIRRIIKDGVELGIELTEDQMGLILKALNTGVFKNLSDPEYSSLGSIVDSIEGLIKEEIRCYVCETSLVEYSGDICLDCINAGYWIDPAGGCHAPGEDDPAKMYE
jgi:hypothetical protein